jgi:hypothetical protein
LFSFVKSLNDFVCADIGLRNGVLGRLFATSAPAKVSLLTFTLFLEVVVVRMDAVVGLRTSCLALSLMRSGKDDDGLGGTFRTGGNTFFEGVFGPDNAVVELQNNIRHELDTRRIQLSAMQTHHLMRYARHIGKMRLSNCDRSLGIGLAMFTSTRKLTFATMSLTVLSSLSPIIHQPDGDTTMSSIAILIRLLPSSSSPFHGRSSHVPTASPCWSMVNIRYARYTGCCVTDLRVFLLVIFFCLT